MQSEVLKKFHQENSESTYFLQQQIRAEVRVVEVLLTQAFDQQPPARMQRVGLWDVGQGVWDEWVGQCDYAVRLRVQSVALWVA